MAKLARAPTVAARHRPPLAASLAHPWCHSPLAESMVPHRPAAGVVPEARAAVVGMLLRRLNPGVQRPAELTRRRHAQGTGWQRHPGRTKEAGVGVVTLLGYY